MPVENLIKKAAGNTALQGALGGVAGGALVSALTSKKSAKTLLKTGGLLAVGGLAYKAYQDYRSNQSAYTRDQLLGRNLLTEIEEEQFEGVIETDGIDCIVIQAMIAAAHADGQLDDTESERIWQHAVEQGLTADQLGRLAEQISSPPGMAQLAVRAVSMEQKIEVYLASLLIMEPGEVRETYLRELKEVLELPEGLTLALRRQTEQDQEVAA